MRTTELFEISLGNVLRTDPSFQVEYKKEIFNHSRSSLRVSLLDDDNNKQ